MLVFKHTIIATIGEMSAKSLAKLFQNNVWKLYDLPKCVIFNRESQFVIELMKELNRMLGIKMKLSTLFHLQTDDQTEKINQKLEQYLQFFIDYRQKNWLEQLAMTEFAVNNKIYSATKMSLLMGNYGRELRMEVNIRKVEKVTKFAERMKKVQEEV